MKRSRTYSLFANVSGSLISRLVNLGSTLIIVPLALKSLGSDDYGIFASILSVVVLFSYSDFGLGLAVVNKVAAVKDHESLLEAKVAISNVWHFLVRASGIILIVGLVVVLSFDAISSTDDSFDTNIWLVLVVCVSLGLAPALTQRILFGAQRNFEANLWNSAGRILSVLGVYLAYIFNASMVWFVIAMVGLPSLVGWVSTIMLWRNTPALKPEKSMVALRKLRNYINDGIQFLFLQLGVFFETGIDNILIGSLLGAIFVTNYDLLSRLFIYVPALISLLAFPLWPAIREAKASGDDKWIKTIMFISYICVAMVSTIAAVIFLYFHVEILHLWVAVKYEPNFELAIPLAIFAVLTSIGTVQTMFLSGMGIVSTQVRILAIFLAVLIPCKYIALTLSGPSLMVWVLVMLYLFRMIALWRVSRVNVYAQQKKI